MILGHGEIQAYNLSLPVGPVKIDCQLVPIIFDVIDGLTQRGNVFMIAVGHSQIDPLQFANGIIKDLPDQMIGHGKGSILIHIHLDGKISDLIRCLGLQSDFRKE